MDFIVKATFKTQRCASCMFQFFHIRELIRRLLFLLLSCYHIVLSCESLGFGWWWMSIDPILRSRFGNGRLYPEQSDELIKHNQSLPRDCNLIVTSATKTCQEQKMWGYMNIVCLSAGHVVVKIFVFGLYRVSSQPITENRARSLVHPSKLKIE